MTSGAGSLDIIARRDGARTVLERIRYDGISRCSRSFRDAGAARIVLSQLGPGVVRGDAVKLTGYLRAHSRLIVTSQSATRLLGGVQRSRGTAQWTLEADAWLQLIGEPLVAAADARYEGSTTIELGPRARVLISETACVPASAEVLLRTTIRQGQHDIFYDAVRGGAAAPHTVGTFAVAGLSDPGEIAGLVRALDADLERRSDVRAGIGQLSCGVYARVLGSNVWDVQTILANLRRTVRMVCFERSPDPLTRPAIGSLA